MMSVTVITNRARKIRRKRAAMCSRASAMRRSDGIGENEGISRWLFFTSAHLAWLEGQLDARLLHAIN